MTDTLFDQNETEHSEAVSSYKELLVGEGKKFKTDEDLAKGKYEADKFIEQLQGELENLRSELTTRKRLEDALDQLESLSLTTEAPETPESTSSAPAAIDETYINKILDKREQERRELQNIEQTKTKLKEIFGSDYVSKLETRAAQLGVDKATLDALAKRSPQAFLALVAPSRTEAPFSPPASKISNPLDTGPAPRTYAWYQKLKKDNPTLYWSPKVQTQLHKDAIAAANRGEDF